LTGSFVSTALASATAVGGTIGSDFTWRPM
jgi:hypothetical protein